ncbi:MAG: FAD-dependent oxidoreductase [Bacteroidota bacterium]
MKRIAAGLALLATLVGGCRNNSDQLMIEAEMFSHTGGWVSDYQFIGEMGSTYLMAHGLGVPVEDAYTTAGFPEPGTWHLYVRTCNWVSPWTDSYAPGTFRVSVGGVPSDTLFGTLPGGWGWQYGGMFTIGEKDVEIRLSDQTGFNGRVDALLFSRKVETDLPAGGDRLRILREKAEAVPSYPRNEGTYDVIVVGGGIAGISSAIAAARSGLTVALIEAGPYPDVNLLQNLNKQAETEEETDEKEPAPGRVFDELRKLEQEDEEELVFQPELVKGYLEAQDGLDLYLNCYVYAAEMKEKRITGIQAFDTRTGARMNFEGLVFIDASGGGRLAGLAGADYSFGRESKEDTDEKGAPAHSDSLIINSSLEWSAERIEDSISFPDCPWALHPDKSCLIHDSHSGGHWETTFRKEYEKNKEYSRDYLLRAIFGNWYGLKTLDAADYGCFKLDRVDYILQPYEGKRYLGAYTLSLKDIRKEKKFDDRFAMISEPLLLHVPDSLNSQCFPGEEFITLVVKQHGGTFYLPYRILYSRNTDNLLLAGKNCSVTHLAFSALQSDRTAGITGETAGLAAALCLELNCTPAKLGTKFAEELKSRLAEGVAEPPLQ